jgi:hypothetical protein
MKFKLIAGAFLAALLPLTSHAYTDCRGVKLTQVWSDVNGDFYISLRSDYQLVGAIRAAQYPSGSKAAIAIALSAYTANRLVTVRYVRDNINCSAAPWNEEISAIAMAGD